MKILLASLAGLIFGFGLILSGMTDPSKVLGFLDVAGPWDPSLGLVMCGAIAFGFVAFRYAAGRKESLLGAAMRMPDATQVDRRLILGGMAFGAGWGLAGYCPGPALASLAMGGEKPWIFFVAMLAGMGIFILGERIKLRKLSAT